MVHGTHMRRGLLLLAFIAAALAVVLALRGHGPHATVAAAAPATATQEEIAAKRLSAVERVVEEKNRNRHADENAFIAGGWTMTSSPPPDMQLVSFDPGLIAAGREKELRTQLASTVPPRRYAHRVAQIVLLAHDPVTRESAVDALSRIHSAEAQDELIDLITSKKLDPEDLGRRQLAALIQPADLDDEIAAKMATLLDSDALTAVEKKQVAFTLAVVGLRDGMSLPDRVSQSMSPQALALLDDMTQLGRRNLIAHRSPPGTHE